MMELLKKLSDAGGASGRETEVRNIIIEELRKNNIYFTIDKMGNVLVKKGSGNKKLMISAHMDEAGFLVTLVDKGFLRVTNIGELKADSLDGVLVNVNGHTGKIINDKKEKDISEMTINLADDTDVNEGDYALFKGGFSEENSYISGKALSSRALCCALLEVIKIAAPECYTVYFVFTVQGELKGRGARAAAYEINPELAVVLEGEPSDDYSGGEGIISLNQGPVLRIRDNALIMHHEIREIIEKAAEKSAVDLQNAVSDELSEGGGLHKELYGIKTGVLALPVRYKHSSLEIAGKKDLEDLIKVLLNMIK